MKTSAVIVAVTAALVSAQAPPEGTNKVTCAKPNANYCYGGDIIVRCDANGVGTAGRCSDNLAGYPPLGGVAECWQSTETSGDAACQKNCVVYAQPSSFTLAASQCTPSFTASATSAPATTLSSSVVGPTGGSSSVVYTSSVIYTTIVNGTVTVTVPCSTVPVGPSSTPAGPVITTTPTGPIGTGIPPPPPPPPTNNGTGASGTNTPVGPTSSGPSTVPTNAAVANRATGALAVMGLVAAAFL